MGQEGDGGVGVAEGFGQDDVGVLADGGAGELHGAGGVDEVARLLEELLVEEGGTGDPERGVDDGDVGVALQLGLLAELLAVVHQRVVVHLVHVLVRVLRVQRRLRNHQPRRDAYALEPAVLRVDAVAAPPQCPAGSPRRLRRQHSPQRLQNCPEMHHHNQSQLAESWCSTQ